MAKFRKKTGNLKEKLLRWSKVLLILGMSQFGFGCKKKEPNLPKKEKIAVVIPEPVVVNPVSNSTYVVDTLDAPRGGVLLFCSGTSIVRYFIENNPSYRMRLYLFVHEQKHKDNFLKGLRALKVSPEQYAKICMHDEISANIAALLTLRYEYLTADDKESVLKKYENSEYDYYFQAIRDKKIFPEKEDRVSRDAEWSFIMNETRDMWMRCYAPIYQPSIWRMVGRYTNRMDNTTPAATQNKYYQKGIKIAYDIGGVDFSKYMEKDIEPEDKDFSLLDQIVNLKICKNKQDTYFKSVQTRLDELKSEALPLSYDVIAQVYFAEALKSALNGISTDEIEKNKQIVGAYYNKLFKRFAWDEGFRRLVCLTMDQEQSFYPFMERSSIDDSEKVYEKIYTYKGTNLSPMISQLPQDIYNPLCFPRTKFDMQTYDAVNVMTLDAQLEKMRQNSHNESKGNSAPITAEKQRKSGKKIIALPDFTQPILEKATPEDMQKIKECIDDFYNIPVVMRYCDLNAQKKYLKEQKRKESAVRTRKVWAKTKGRGRR